MNPKLKRVLHIVSYTSIGLLIFGPVLYWLVWIISSGFQPRFFSVVPLWEALGLSYVFCYAIVAFITIPVALAGIGSSIWLIIKNKRSPWYFIIAACCIGFLIWTIALLATFF